MSRTDGIAFAGLLGCAKECSLFLPLFSFLSFFLSFFFFFGLFLVLVIIWNMELFLQSYLQMNGVHCAFA